MAVRGGIGFGEKIWSFLLFDELVGSRVSYWLIVVNLI